jgi:hypothetical protein
MWDFLNVRIKVWPFEFIQDRILVVLNNKQKTQTYLRKNGHKYLRWEMHRFFGKGSKIFETEIVNLTVSQLFAAG